MIQRKEMKLRSVVGGILVTLMIVTSLIEEVGAAWDTSMSLETPKQSPGWSHYYQGLSTATMDFNGDGKSDLLMYNAAAGTTYLWLMSGTSIASGISPATIADINWQIAGAGDFDGDGKTDMFWYNATTGVFYIWLMDGSTIKSGGSPASFVNTLWQIKGIRDFNGDGRSDILWYNATTGLIYIWLMNGASISSVVSPGIVGDTTWQIKGVGEFNGDGKTDILWYNTSTRVTYIWLMDGLSIKSGGSPATLPDANLQVKAIGDFNGDGKSDICFKNTSTGSLYIWLMNGASVTSAGSPAILDSNWQIILDGGNLALSKYTYKLPDTGQTGDYTATSGEDSDYTSNPPSYIDNGNGTITDNVTGMMWQKSPDTNSDGIIGAADKLTYAKAKSYCQNLTLAGYNDWRLPNIKQLYSLINFNGTDPSGYSGSSTSGLVPFISTKYFDFAYGDIASGERIIDAQYASSTLYVANTGNDDGSTLFGVNFADGRIKGYGLGFLGGDKTFYVKCSRGNTNYGQNDFVDNSNGTIIDNATGLMWTQNDSGTGLNWEGALAWVAQKNATNYLGYSDWRLPNAKELQALVDYSRSPSTTGSAAINPLFKVTAITNEAGEVDYPYYWSGTTHANWTVNPGKFAVYVAFGRAMGYMNGHWIDVHGAGAQRSDPKDGNSSDWPNGNGPQGDAIRIKSYIRMVRNML
ncbi:MAG: DUF1566 domain-containing protein [Nitrospirae bacterium]|nr:DUF1566 domain-containing protein [Nitrospirota bacterium]